MSNILFAVTDFDGMLMVSVVPEDYWKKYGYMDDRLDEEIFDKMKSLGFGQEMEDTFFPYDENLTKEGIISLLEEDGLVHSDEVEKFVGDCDG